MRSFLFPTFLFLLFIASGHIPQTTSRFRSELDELERRGISYRFLYPELVELRDEQSGQIRQLGIDNRRDQEIDQTIFAWADTEGVPILEIDPALIDTSLYEGWFNNWVEIPVSNSWIPVVIGDINDNGKPEFYGSYKDFATDFETRAYEVDSLGIVSLVYNYVPRPGIARQFTDVDKDLLDEVCFSLGGLVSGFEQPALDSLPTGLVYSHQRHQGGLDPGFTGMIIGDLDADEFVDFLYSGSEQDSTKGNVAKTYVAEYDPDSLNFFRKWSSSLSGNGGTCGFSRADFDLDYKIDFVASNIFGEIFVVENSFDNSYVIVWQDSLPFQKLCYHGFGDIDGDGLAEFFVTSTLGSGNWLLAIESNNNDSYTINYIIKLPHGGILDEPTILAADMNGDNQDDLVVTSANNIFVLSSHSDNYYELYYFMPVPFFLNSVQTSQFWSDTFRSLVVSGDTTNDAGRIRKFCRIYRPGLITSVDNSIGSTVAGPDLFALFPNPFNASVTISYSLQDASYLTLAIYDISGSLVETIQDGFVSAGVHTLSWNASRFASGVFLCRMKAGGKVLTQKVLLLK